MNTTVTTQLAGFDAQLILVSVVALVAGLYSLRVFLRQFRQSDDEPQGCAACPAAELGAGRPADSSAPASPAATNLEALARTSRTSRSSRSSSAGR